MLVVLPTRELAIQVAKDFTDSESASVVVVVPQCLLFFSFLLLSFRVLIFLFFPFQLCCFCVCCPRCLIFFSLLSYFFPLFLLFLLSLSTFNSGSFCSFIVLLFMSPALLSFVAHFSRSTFGPGTTVGQGLRTTCTFLLVVLSCCSFVRVCVCVCCICAVWRCVSRNCVVSSGDSRNSTHFADKVFTVEPTTAPKNVTCGEVIGASFEM